MTTFPAPTQPIVFLHDLFRLIGDAARGVSPISDLAPQLPGAFKALDLLEHTNGHRYRIRYPPSRRGWQLIDDGPLRPKTTFATSKTPRMIVAHTWAQGLFVLRRISVSNPPLVVADGPPLAPGHRVAAELTIFDDAAAAPTQFLIREAPILVDVDGAPQSTAFLSAFSAADLQNALYGGGR